MDKVLFMPWKKAAVADGSRDILQLAQQIDLPLRSTCGGKKICGKCRVIVEETGTSLSKPTELEKMALGKLLQKGYRLACETIPKGPATVKIPEESQFKRQVVLTSDTPHPHPVRLRPTVRQYFVEVPSPVLNSVIGDRERLLLALQDTYGLKRLTLDPFALRRLPSALASARRGVTATLWNKRDIIDLCPGTAPRLVGMAFDVGTTTVVGYLMDLETGERLSITSAVNPQIVFGADVISRISFCQENENGLEKLRIAIIKCLNGLIMDASQDAEIYPDLIMEVTVAGNTVMHHFLTGLDPRYLAMAPYAPVLQNPEDLKARDLGLEVGKSAYVHLLPLKAGFVGGDTIACILATGLHRTKVPSLLVDLGTNGEIVLACKDRLICCSTAAGPAFEGGHIRWGMRASAGAIEKVKVDPGTLDVRVKTITGKRPLGLCGSGLISATAEMIRRGIILEKGNFNKEIRSPRLRRGEDGGEFVLTWASEAGNNHDITVTQKDVAELQLAKSAICAGATLLREFFGGEQIRRILLAGAFGNYVDPQDACTLDLLPDSHTARIIGVGNAAGYGACLALLDNNKRREGQRLSKKLQYQELAATQRFQDLFIEGMRFTSARDYRVNP